MPTHWNEQKHISTYSPPKFLIIGPPRKIEDDAQYITLQSSLMFFHGMHHLIVGCHPSSHICHHQAACPQMAISNWLIVLPTFCKLQWPKFALLPLPSGCRMLRCHICTVSCCHHQDQLGDEFQSNSSLLLKRA